MSRSASTIALAILATAISTACLQPAFAACTRLGASVNDYGKDGPTADAKVLLDKYVAKWATDHGIKTYRTGTKEVKCELFLNLIVFDEHTCRAEATVCWDGAPVTPPVTQAAATSDKPATPTDKPATPSTVKKVATPIVKPVAAAPATIETRTVPAVAKPVVAAPADKDKAPVATKPAPASADATVAQQALVAAQRAAEAAERAAAAAERAAASAAAGATSKP
jgi:hypothetical protein